MINVKKQVAGTHYELNVNERSGKINYMAHALNKSCKVYDMGYKEFNVLMDLVGEAMEIQKKKQEKRDRKANDSAQLKIKM
jgi:hypothetical protein